MIILSICAILFIVVVIDAVIIKLIRQKEAGKILGIQQEYNQLQIEYKKKITLLQKLKTLEQTLQAKVTEKQKTPATRPDSQHSEKPNTQDVDVAGKLLEQGIITQEQFKKALKYRQGTGTGRPLEEILVLLGAVDQRTINAFSRP